MPRMNAVMERWVRSCRTELLDRTLIWNQAHLLHALREYEQFYNQHRPHRPLAGAAPLRPLPDPSPNPTGSPSSTSADTTASAASCTSTNTWRDQHGRGSWHLHRPSPLRSGGVEKDKAERGPVPAVLRAPGRAAEPPPGTSRPSPRCRDRPSRVSPCRVRA
ncbi:integrase core domain-containing protein [Streptomyces mirabilis]|uniref:integrase core domain-containing protein n=1 Tax=Streptomyces mirabilis TaxID=68239 RepID=UPI0037F70B33